MLLGLVDKCLRNSGDARETFRSESHFFERDYCMFSTSLVRHVGRRICLIITVQSNKNSVCLAGKRAFDTKNTSFARKPHKIAWKCARAKGKKNAFLNWFFCQTKNKRAASSYGAVCERRMRITKHIHIQFELNAFRRQTIHSSCCRPYSGGFSMRTLAGFDEENNKIQIIFNSNAAHLCGTAHHCY